MNPAYPSDAYPPEAVALQERGPDEFPRQPVGPTMVQYTTVNMPSEPPRDYIIWSLCNFFHGNPFCLGLAAFVFSIKARDRKVVGDQQGAQHYGSTARCLNICATVISSVIALIFIIVLIVISVQVHHAVNTFRGYRGNNYDYRYKK